MLYTILAAHGIQHYFAILEYSSSKGFRDECWIYSMRSIDINNIGDRSVHKIVYEWVKEILQVLLQCL